MTKRKLPPLTREDYAAAYKRMFGRDFVELDKAATRIQIDRMYDAAEADLQKLIAANNADIAAGRRVPPWRHAQATALFETMDWLTEILARLPR